MERQWCDECKAMREVDDRSDESQFEGNTEVVYRVTFLSCGHQPAYATGKTYKAFDGFTDHRGWLSR